MKVLVTDGEYGHTLDIIRSLEKNNIKTDILCKSKFSLCNLSKYGRCIIGFPGYDKEDQAISFILKKIKEAQ